MYKKVIPIIQYGANKNIINDYEENMCQHIDRYLDEKFRYDFEHDPKQKRSIEENNIDRFIQWKNRAIKEVESIIDKGVKEARITMDETKRVVMEAMAMVGRLKPKLWLSKNVLSVIMDFHGGVGDAITEKDLDELRMTM